MTIVGMIGFFRQGGGMPEQCHGLVGGTPRIHSTSYLQGSPQSRQVYFDRLVSGYRLAIPCYPLLRPPYRRTPTVAVVCHVVTPRSKVNGVVNPSRAPEPLPILNPSNFVPKKGFPVVKGLSAFSPRKNVALNLTLN